MFCVVALSKVGALSPRPVVGGSEVVGVFFSYFGVGFGLGLFGQLIVLCLILRPDGLDSCDIDLL